MSSLSYFSLRVELMVVCLSGLLGTSSIFFVSFTASKAGSASVTCFLVAGISVGSTLISAALSYNAEHYLGEGGFS